MKTFIPPNTETVPGIDARFLRPVEMHRFARFALLKTNNRVEWPATVDRYWFTEGSVVPENIWHRTLSEKSLNGMGFREMKSPGDISSLLSAGESVALNWFMRIDSPGNRPDTEVSELDRLRAENERLKSEVAKLREKHPHADLPSDDPGGPQVTRSGRTITVELWYPRISERANTVQIGLSDVRAADDIRVEYDFDRDGWVIRQEVLIPDVGGHESTGEWREVAFVQAWELENEQEGRLV